MEIDRALGWLQATPVAKAISENEILFPLIETIHVLAIVLWSARFRSSIPDFGQPV